MLPDPWISLGDSMCFIAGIIQSVACFCALTDKAREVEGNRNPSVSACRIQTSWILKTHFSEADDLLWEAAQLCQVAIQVQAAEELQ